MSMAWLCLLLVAHLHTAATETDVTPRLTFSYSKSLLNDLCFFLCFWASLESHGYPKISRSADSSSHHSSFFWPVLSFEGACGSSCGFIGSFCVNSSTWPAVSHKLFFFKKASVVALKLARGKTTSTSELLND